MLVALLAAAFALPPHASAPELAALTFNIRYGTAADGPNHWTHRRDMVFDVLRTGGWDVVGLQEALKFQLDEIAAAAPGLAQVGVGRDDGLARGEFCPILYRADRFILAASGTFWLSDSPERPGSASWGNRITRICTWARLVDRQSARAFTVWNLHLDHQSQPSRERAVELLAARLADRPFPGEPAIVLGDFNAGESNPAIRYLLGSAPRASSGDHPAPPSPRLLDTFREIDPDAAQVGTFTGFDLAAQGGEKIDYVLVTPGFEILDAAIDRRSRDGRYPSDHFPVSALLRLP